MERPSGVRDVQRVVMAVSSLHKNDPARSSGTHLFMTPRRWHPDTRWWPHLATVDCARGRYDRFRFCEDLSVAMTPMSRF
jgi:hypothetical protein